MRTAICFNGLVGSTKGKSEQLIGDFNKCFEISSTLYKKHIIDKNDVDIFVHSWSTDLEDEILQTYNPKKYIIEEQEVFDIPEYIEPIGSDEVRKQTHYSLWKSRKNCMELKTQYEQENNFKYDCVMLARFDMAWQSDLIFENYDQNLFWTQSWPKKILNGKMLKDIDYWRLRDSGYSFETKWWGYPHNDEGLLGMWFFSNSDNMNKFATLYDCLGEYSIPGNCPVDESGRISAHRQSLYHLEKIGLLDNLRLSDKNWHDDCPTVRRRYFKEK
tara:strand:- start:846 stop:1664 length:819 start_codon:yes stop_codon:yes gene_type:complete